MHRFFKRGLVAAAAVATVTTPVAVLATQAGAQPTKGQEALNLTIYEVGQPAANPTASVGGGPATAGGIFVGKGNVADLPAPPTADANSVFAFPTGTFEVLVTGGRFVVANLNPNNCKFIANVINAKGTLNSGTGVFATATATFKVNASITGTLARGAGGACNTLDNSQPALDTVHATAVGRINLRGATA
jgi:hypothetical protein